MRKYFMIGTVMAAMVLTVGCGNGKNIKNSVYI